MSNGEADAPGGMARLLAALRAWSGRRSARGRPAVLRLIAPLAVLVVAAIVVCTTLAYVLATQADDYLEAEHRQALAGAVEALEAVSPDLARVDSRLIHVLERASGLRELRFEADPVDGREVQPMLDAKGRIVGWFNWEPERPATATMNRLLPFAGAIVLGLVGFAALAMWQLRRLGVELATSEQHAQKLEHQDVLTGLPNHNRFFELFDRTVADGKGEATLAFAVLDLDDFDEVNDALGYAGGDEVLAEIGNRLQQSLPPGAVIGRLGGDEFALLITDTEPQAALAAADLVRRSLMRPFWMNQLVQLSVSIGLAVAPRDGSPATSFCAAPISRCVRPSIAAAGRFSHLLPTWKRNSRSEDSSSARLHGRSLPRASIFITSPSSRPTEAASWAWRRCCDGSIPGAAWCRRRCSCRSRRKRA